MQSAEKVKGKGSKHDTDLLQASNVLTFKQWLKDQGVTVSDPSVQHAKDGVLFWAAVPNTHRGNTLVSVCEGYGRKSRYARTHERLRPFLSQFFANPVAKAVNAAVRKAKSGTIQIVVNNKLQTPAVNEATANIAKPAPIAVKAEPTPVNVPAPLTRPLLSQVDVESAFRPIGYGPIPDNAHARTVFAVRVGGESAGGDLGPTVVAEMRVNECQIPGPDNRAREVEVIELPIHTKSPNLQSLATRLADIVAERPGAVVLVDLRGSGSAFLDMLKQQGGASLRCFGLLLGQQLPKSNGEYSNRRAQCMGDAVKAIRSGAMVMHFPLRDRADAGVGLPYTVSHDGRMKLWSPQELREQGHQIPYVLETISMAYVEGVDFLNPDLVTVAAPVTAASAPVPGKVDDFLTDLRDDFAINCPLLLGTGETLDAFAIRRWEYAQAMVKNRPSDVRG